ncbi:MAG: hypothetical protein NT027_13865 [Proteobacteria bacterium]|nr:hypothetical protein [Pseudomonadota bacterium]
MDIKKIQIIDYYIGNSMYFFIRPVTQLLGKILRRNHDILPRRDMLFIKIVGGGSVVLAYPAILSIRRQYPDIKLKLLCTKAVEIYARPLGVFDDFILVETGSFLALITSGIKALCRSIGVDTIVDLEVYSRISGIFALATLARNRIGFYLESSQWRLGVYTKLLFFNRFSGSFYFYDQIALMLNCKPVAIEDARNNLLNRLKAETGSSLALLSAMKPISSNPCIAVGHACSDLGKERILLPNQWSKVLGKKFSKSDTFTAFILGGKSDFQSAEALANEINRVFPNSHVVNVCGKLTLEESMRLILNIGNFWGIDSGLLHYSRLLAHSVHSFWGPTLPESRLRPHPFLVEDVVHYAKVPCSPCVHVAETPPCNGNNLCIRSMLDAAGSSTLNSGILNNPYWPQDSHEFALEERAS